MAAKKSSPLQARVQRQKRPRSQKRSLTKTFDNITQNDLKIRLTGADDSLLHSPSLLGEPGTPKSASMTGSTGKLSPSEGPSSEFEKVTPLSREHRLTPLSLPALDQDADPDLVREVFDGVAAYFKLWSTEGISAGPEYLFLDLALIHDRMRTILTPRGNNQLSLKVKFIGRPSKFRYQYWCRIFKSRWANSAREVLAKEFECMRRVVSRNPQDQDEAIFTELARKLQAMASSPPEYISPAVWDTHIPILVDDQMLMDALTHIDLWHKFYQDKTYETEEKSLLWLLIWRTLKRLYLLLRAENYKFPSTLASSHGDLYSVEKSFFTKAEIVKEFEAAASAIDATNPARPEYLVGKYCVHVAACRKENKNHDRHFPIVDEQIIDTIELEALKGFCAGSAWKDDYLQLLHRTTLRLNSILGGPKALHRWSVNTAGDVVQIWMARAVEGDIGHSQSPETQTTEPQLEERAERSAFAYAHYPMPETRANQIAESRRITRDLNMQGIVSHGPQVEDIVNLPPNHARITIESREPAGWSSTMVARRGTMGIFSTFSGRRAPTPNRPIASQVPRPISEMLFHGTSARVSKSPSQSSNAIPAIPASSGNAAQPDLSEQGVTSHDYDPTGLPSSPGIPIYESPHASFGGVPRFSGASDPAVLRERVLVDPSRVENNSPNPPDDMTKTESTNHSNEENHTPTPDPIMNSRNVHTRILRNPQPDLPIPSIETEPRGPTPSSITDQWTTQHQEGPCHPCPMYTGQCHHSCADCPGRETRSYPSGSGFYMSRWPSINGSQNVQKGDGSQAPTTRGTDSSSQNSPEIPNSQSDPGSRAQSEPPNNRSANNSPAGNRPPPTREEYERMFKDELEDELTRRGIPPRDCIPYTNASFIRRLMDADIAGNYGRGAPGYRAQQIASTGTDPGPLKGGKDRKKKRAATAATPTAASGGHRSKSNSKVSKIPRPVKK